MVSRDQPEEPATDTLTADGVHDYFQRIARFRLLDHQEVVELCRSIEVGLFAGESARLPGAPRPEVRELLQLQRDGEAAFEAMVRHNLRLVVSVARTLTASTTSMLDVIQAGNAGLLVAVQRFDWTLGYRFSTYATWWIRKMINTELATSRAIRLPPTPLARFLQMNRVERALGESLSRDPSVTEIAAAAAMSAADILFLRRIGQRLLSLDQPVDAATDSTLLDVLPDDAEDLPDRIHEEELRCRLREHLEALGPTAARILTIRYGLDGDRPYTPRSVALMVGRPTAEVESIEREALAALRTALEPLV